MYSLYFALHIAECFQVLLEHTVLQEQLNFSFINVTVILVAGALLFSYTCVI